MAKFTKSSTTGHSMAKLPELATRKQSQAKLPKFYTNVLQMLAAGAAVVDELLEDSCQLVAVVEKLLEDNCHYCPRQNLEDICVNISVRVENMNKSRY